MFSKKTRYTYVKQCNNIVQGPITRSLDKQYLLCSYKTSIETCASQIKENENPYSIVYCSVLCDGADYIRQGDLLDNLHKYFTIIITNN